MLKIILLIVVSSLLAILPTPNSHALDVNTNVNVYRFYRLGAGTHFYTSSETEARRVRDSMKAYYRYEGVVFSASSVGRTGLGAVYRFFNKNSNTHFYTTSPTEAHKIKELMYKIYRYEGVAYYTNTSHMGNNLLPVYRFYNRITGTHFYTGSTTEKNRLLVTQNHSYRYESIAYGAARYFKNCTDARTYGVVPIYRNEPGYGTHLDRDNDGIACEVT